MGERNADNNVLVDDSLSAVGALFDKLTDQAASIDTTLKVTYTRCENRLKENHGSW